MEDTPSSYEAVEKTDEEKAKKYAYLYATKISHLHEPSPNPLFSHISQPEWHLAAGWDMCVRGHGCTPPRIASGWQPCGVR
jgi:hypothetical protein